MERVRGYEPLDRGSTPLSCTNRTGSRRVRLFNIRRQKFNRHLHWTRAVNIYRRGKSHDFPLLFFELFYLELEVI